jgi:Uma2 family endonuclease
MPQTKTPRTKTSRTKAVRTNGWSTFADILHDLGDVDPKRVCANPLPGEATEADLLRIQTHEDRNCELVDGVLVEKVMGYPEACLTTDLIFVLRLYLRENDLGYVVAPDGPTRLFAGLVRMPDLAFVSWDKVPTKEYPSTPIANVVPNLAVEVLSEGNTRGEMERKRKEYFLAGVELLWVVDPAKRTVDIYTAPDVATTLREQDTLDGGTVLPGFALPLKQLFARLPKNLRGRPAKKPKSK